MIVLLLHVLEKNIEVRGLGDKGRLKHCIREFKVLARMQYSYDIISRIGVYGNSRIALCLDYLEYLLIGRLLRDKHERTAGSHNVLGGHTVELKHIFNIFDIILIQASLIGTCIEHEDYVLLGDRLFLFVRVDSEQTENSVCRDGEQPYDGAENYCQTGNSAAHMLRELFLVLHGDALGYKLAEHEGKERENERYHDNGCGIYYTDTALGDIKGADGKARQPLCEVVGSECRAEKAGKGDAYLNSREKARRLLDHFQHLFRLFVAVVGACLDLFLVQGYHRDLGRGEESIQQNKY